MHRTAEYGIAAHWKYKEGVSNVKDNGDEFQWVRQLLETEKEYSDPSEYISSIKIDLFADEVFVFTPKGDVFNLPSASTTIDFAFMIHSAVGWRMTGAKVNGKIVPIDTVLHNGDIVEIITSASSSGPHTDWLKIVRTSQARSKINHWFKKEKREENITKGREQLEKEFKKYGLTLKQFWDNEGMTVYVLKKFSVSKMEDFYAIVGYGGISLEKISNRINEYMAKTKAQTPEELIAAINSQKHTETKSKGKTGVVVNGVENCLIRMAKCCSPVPGDAVVGYITRGRGVTIHRHDCTALMNIEKSDGDRGRIIEVTWEESDSEPYKADLIMTAVDRSGLLVDTALALNDMHIPVITINAKVQKDGNGIINMTVEISGREQLANVLARLNNIKGVIGADRA
jgi:GTP pyrophosphokinase